MKNVATTKLAISKVYGTLLSKYKYIINLTSDISKFISLFINNNFT